MTRRWSPACRASPPGCWKLTDPAPPQPGAAGRLGDFLLGFARFLRRPARHAGALALDLPRKLLLLLAMLAVDVAVGWAVLDPLSAWLALEAGAEPKVLGSWDVAWPGGATLLLWALLEETGFRLWLRPGALNVATSGAVLALLLSDTGPAHTALRMAGLAAVAALAAPRSYEWLAGHATGAMVHASALLFALAHLPNFDAPPSAALALALLPQWFGGYLFAYVRLRLGFGWAVSLHAVHNWLAFLLEAA